MPLPSERGNTIDRSWLSRRNATQTEPPRLPPGARICAGQAAVSGELHRLGSWHSRHSPTSRSSHRRSCGVRSMRQVRQIFGPSGTREGCRVREVRWSRSRWSCRSRPFWVGIGDLLVLGGWGNAALPQHAGWGSAGRRRFWLVQPGGIAPATAAGGLVSLGWMGRVHRRWPPPGVLTSGRSPSRSSAGHRDHPGVQRRVWATGR